jgi:hypothetical protein
MAPQFCKCLHGIDFEDPEDFMTSCDKATSCVGLALETIAICAFRRLPMVGTICQRMLEQIDWEAIASRLMNDAWSKMYWELELSKEE